MKCVFCFFKLAILGISIWNFRDVGWNTNLVNRFIFQAFHGRFKKQELQELFQQRDVSWPLLVGTAVLHHGIRISWGFFDFWIWLQFRVTYCWWKKSCKSWYGKYLIIYRGSYMSGGCLGFFSINSTVLVNFMCVEPGGIKNWLVSFFVPTTRSKTNNKSKGLFIHWCPLIRPQETLVSDGGTLGGVG